LERKEAEDRIVRNQFIHDLTNTALVCYIDRQTHGLSPLTHTAQGPHNQSTALLQLTL
jgi:hypothetical protein